MGSTTCVVFFHIASDAYGGGSQMVARLIRSLDREQFDPVVLTQRRDPFVEAVEEYVTAVEAVPFRGTLDTYRGGLVSKNPLTLAATTVRLSQFNVETRDVLASADVVWCHNIRAVLTVGPQLQARGIPTIWNVGLGQSSDGLYRWLNGMALRLADVVFGESRTQLERMFTDAQVARHGSKFVTFHKGIDTDRYAPNEGGFDSAGLHVGTAAVLSPRKGIEDFLRAAATVLADRDDVTFHVAGSEATDHEGYESELRDLAADIGIADTVVFHGWVETMPEYLNALDVFVLASYAEGIPGAVREALATGTPVVATDVGETASVVRHGKTGRLVEPGAPSALAAAISALLDDSENRGRMGERGRDLVVRKHSVERYVERYEELLERLCTDRALDSRFP